MKRRNTREILVGSFRQLAARKSVDKITIREIVDNCGYSTVTFYRQFLDKYDMISWAYSEDLKKIMIDNEAKLDELVLQVARYYCDNRVYLLNLFRHTSGYDSFIRNMTEINFDFFNELIRKANGGRELDKQLLMESRLYVLGAVYFTCELILENKAFDEKFLNDIYVKTLPVEINEILRKL